MKYSIDPTVAQKSIVTMLENFVFPWGVSTVIVGGLHDSEEVPKWSTGSVKPFIVINFGAPHRHYRGRGFGGAKLDNHRSTLIIECVANNGETAIDMQNILSDALIGFIPVQASQIVASESSWEGARVLLDSSSAPSRFVTNSRYSFGVVAKAAPAVTP